jgi:glycosyltransferase involved in cell wall biosynthesis
MPQRLRIAQVAPLGVNVPPATYGGTQRMVYLLTEELVKRGYPVTLFASRDSQTSAALRAVCEQGLAAGIRSGEIWHYYYYPISAAAEALREASSFDVIHFHLGCLSLPLGAITRTAILHTLPSPLYADDHWMLLRYPEAAVTARSLRQIAELSEDRRKKIRVVYNGCDFESYNLSAAPGRYLAFLGRMAPEKSPLDAIRIARTVGMPIVLAGEPWNPDEEAYFGEQIRPLIDGKAVVHIGPVNDAQKNEFFQNAAALLFPIRWEEPFGIVMIEAMACGVPVVACNRGAVSEVIDFGKTGFFADSAAELPPLVARALTLDRAAVREHARRRFSHQRMADDYLRIYESLAAEPAVAASSHG